MAMIYSERKRLEELMKREANGEKIWITKIPPEFRQKLLWLVDRYGDHVNKYDSDLGARQILDSGQLFITHSIGQPSLYGSKKPEDDMRYHILNATDEQYPDILEALSVGLKYRLSSNYSSKEETEISLITFDEDVNKLLESYRIGYSLENGNVIDFTSRELHVEVIAPVLHLLMARGWENVEVAYQDALKELSRGKTDNAITDATTALQEALRKVGCKGDTFEALMKSAKDSILKGFDAKYVGGIEKFVDWASAARAKKGDTHKVTKPTKNEAWFVVHMVGTLLLYLSKLK